MDTNDLHKNKAEHNSKQPNGEDSENMPCIQKLQLGFWTPVFVASLCNLFTNLSEVFRIR